MRVRRTVTPDFQENCYLLVCEQTGEAVLVDPGGRPDDIAALVEREQAKPVAIWNTHAHIDHVGAVAALQRRFGVPFRLADADRDWIDGLPVQARMFGLRRVEAPRVDGGIADGEEIAFGAVRGRALATPGHTEGGFCFHFPDEKLLFTGDTLFVSGVGRTDLPGGSWETLERSIRERLFTLPDDTVFYPGHGPHGRIGDERRDNPFLGG